MQFKALLIASVASVAVAQSVTSSAASSTATACAAQIILDSCVGSIQAQLNSCDSNDYSCLCAGYINMLTCYDNCPNDTGASTVQQQRTQNCNAASVYSSTTVLSTAPATSAASSGASSATSTSSSAAVESGSASGTSSGSSSTPSETGTSGAENVKAAGGLLALVFAGAAALL